MSKTTVVNLRDEPYDVYIGRPSKWGNPFTHVLAIAEAKGLRFVDSREEAVAQYRTYVEHRPDLVSCLHELRGKRLGCWCAPEACHGDVLAELADRAEVPA